MNAYQAMHGLLSRAINDRNVHVLGEALELSPATRGLLSASPDQVHLLPAADASLVGLSVGLAMSGARPVVELSGPDALWGALQQLGQEAAPLRNAGEFQAPVVLRVPVAPGEPMPVGLLQQLEGVAIGCPASPEDAVALLQAALEGVDPVVLIEPREVLGRRMSGEPARLQFGEAVVRREGTDATILAWGPGVAAAMDAADALKSEALSVEVVDLRTLSPLDTDVIAESVNKTGHPILAGGPDGVLLGTILAAFLRLECPPAQIDAEVDALSEAVRRAVNY